MHRKLMFILTLMLSGRAMTLAFILRTGGATPGDPPSAWLMPLVGDAIIGVTALWIAFLILKKTGLWVWTAIIVWNALAIWDALSAFIIHITNPWPEFFMIELLGPSMFFAASAMHLAIIVLACQSDVRKSFLD
ncbi:MAG: hypothetical protein AMJ53_12620 [Gammaproteobacteria bacterium SG8_11]|nr:MAG: hypothetical protein AMJ53_12620 [Gammaproteobacteria bacterium SG8_11]